jgi:hypothetical protein
MHLDCSDLLIKINVLDTSDKHQITQLVQQILAVFELELREEYLRDSDGSLVDVSGLGDCMRTPFVNLVIMFLEEDISYYYLLRHVSKIT